jgi:ribosome-associated protein
MIHISPKINIPDHELVYQFIHALGPGGQNVNKVATSVQLRFDFKRSTALPDDIKARLVILAGRNINKEGVLIIEAKRFRTQVQNRSAAKQRLVTLINKAMVKLKHRHPTHPTKISQEKQVNKKKLKSKLKSLRQSIIE